VYWLLTENYVLNANILVFMLILTELFSNMSGLGLTLSGLGLGLMPIWILLKQETVSGSGISWAICKSAPRSRQITTPAPHHSVLFTGRMPFLPPSQQRQSTEGTHYYFIELIILLLSSWCHCHPKTPSCLASFKSRLVLFVWYWLTQVVLEKRPCNGCGSSSWRAVMSLIRWFGSARG